MKKLARRPAFLLPKRIRLAQLSAQRGDCLARHFRRVLSAAPRAYQEGPRLVRLQASSESSESESSSQDSLSGRSELPTGSVA